MKSVSLESEKCAWQLQNNANNIIFVYLYYFKYIYIYDWFSLTVFYVILVTYCCFLNVILFI